MKKFIDYIKESLLDNDENIVNGNQLSDNTLVKSAFERLGNNKSSYNKNIDDCVDIISGIGYKVEEDNIREVLREAKSYLFIINEVKKSKNVIHIIFTSGYNLHGYRIGWSYDGYNAHTNYVIAGPLSSVLEKSLDNNYNIYALNIKLKDTIKDTIDNLIKKIYESLLDDEENIIDKKFCYKVGSYYNDGKIEGIVASIKENGDPHLIMSLDEPEGTMTWHKAMEYNNTLNSGWHIPSKEELEEVWHDDPKVTDILNKALKKYNGVALYESKYYWSSSEFGELCAWGVGTYLGFVYDRSKGNDFYVRPFVTL